MIDPCVIGRCLTSTCFDDAAQLIEQEFVVSSSVQALLHVAVEFKHHALHICVLVLVDTRHTQIATSQFCINTEFTVNEKNAARRTTPGLMQLATNSNGRI